ncbi:MAG: hypothetical protein J7M25_04370 [Deltaproteobacteria bacterium]|nr:hypothetical protein [Deltaproteobacteria bacterium]
MVSNNDENAPGSVQKVAVPLFGRYVAPRFCFAQEVLVATVEAGQVLSTEVRELQGPERFARQIMDLQRLGVRVLLCGGFNRRFMPLAEQLGMTILWGLMGPAEDVVERYAAGTLPVNDWNGRRPGRRGRRRRRRYPKEEE